MSASNTQRFSHPLVREDLDAYKFKVSRRTFIDKDILDIEREYIFNRCWLYIGHESEIANPNDFVRRKVGGRELILNRDRKGKAHAFHNTCPHRGAMVVREPCGNQLGFQCFYHGWAFRNDGAFATRIHDGNYPENFNDDGHANLPEVANFDSYRGFYFVNFSKNAEPLVDYLADAKIILDIVSDHSEAGMEIIGGEQQYSMRANWKLLCENSLDGYHAATTHETYFKYLLESGVNPDFDMESGRYIDLGRGHGVVESIAPWGRPVATWVPHWGEEAKPEVAEIERKLIAKHGEEYGKRITRKSRNAIIFPNLVINDIMAITIRTFYPDEPGFMKVNAWALGPKDESPRMRDIRLYNYLEFLGPGGFATPDDNEALEACRAGYTNAGEAAWNDISKGMMRNEPHTDDEAQMRGFWREWARRTQEAFQ
ncbi:MAG: Rieske 2Fe-2S domain-containing protein [Hyphomonadaceae bacterium]